MIGGRTRVEAPSAHRSVTSPLLSLLLSHLLLTMTTKRLETNLVKNDKGKKRDVAVGEEEEEGRGEGEERGGEEE